MSPKIDLEASWSHHKDFSAAELEMLYKSVFKNAEDILTGYKVYYKFIYDYTDQIVHWSETWKYISELKKLGVSNERILLMALTPDDPDEKDKEFWEQSQRKTAQKALELGFRYSPRLHVNLGLE